MDAVIWDGENGRRLDVGSFPWRGAHQPPASLRSFRRKRGRPDVDGGDVDRGIAIGRKHPKLAVAIGGI